MYKRQENWGLKKLAYPIQKKSTGFYQLIDFNAEPTVIEKQMCIRDRCLSGYGCHGRTGSEVDGMSWYTARFLLLGADSGVGMLGRDCLLYTSRCL